VQPDARVGRARPARHEADARAAAQLALRLGHERRATLVAAGDETDALALRVEAVEHGEETFAGDAEGVGHALRDQRLDQRVAGGRDAGWETHPASVPRRHGHCCAHAQMADSGSP
jgi:hypothetical protein